MSSAKLSNLEQQKISGDESSASFQVCKDEVQEESVKDLKTLEQGPKFVIEEDDQRTRIINSGSLQSLA
jgi:hypothetical protein